MNRRGFFGGLIGALMLPQWVKPPVRMVRLIDLPAANAPEIRQLVALLNQTNQLLNDMPWREG